MSVSSDRLEGFDFGRVLGWIEGYYHVALVLALAGFMFWNRVRTWGRFVVDGEVLFSGNDAWYHYRQVSYTVEHWPSTMPFDPWTFFPNGNASGQFGTLFDQIIATVALVVGLGNPDQGTVAMVTLLAPAAFGVLVVIPAYFIGKRLGGRLGGVVAVTVIALASGNFLRRSLVGFSDHHVAEALFQSLAILAIMVAVSVAARDKPIYEQVTALDVGPLREPLGWAVLAGIAITLYLWVWPFGAMLLGILGVFFVVQLSAEVLRGESPEHTAFAGAVALSVTGVIVLASVDSLGMSPAEHSLLQPALAFAGAIGCVFMAWLARTWERRSLPGWGYPATILGTVAVGTVALLVVAPDVFDLFYNNVVRVFGFWIDPTETGRTVGEVQPLPRLGLLYEYYGFAIIIATGAAIWILGRIFVGRQVAPEHTLVLVWAAFLGMATLTQQRFEYYLVVPVAGLTGYVIGGIFRWLNMSFDVESIEFYQVVSMFAVVLVIVAPMLVGPSSALVTGDRNGPGQDIQAWSESLHWMQDNTPEEGLYDDDSTDLEFYGTYERTDDFEYEAGSYGIMSWWDYGHWITQQGQRIPHANPHQQGSNTAANFLLADSEAQANDVLAGIDENEDAQNRYVMVDWKMANTHTANAFFYRGQRWSPRPNGKFFAPTQFYDAGNVQLGDYYRTLYYESPNSGFGSFSLHEQPYYESQVVRLYHYHGSAVEPRPIVVQWGPGEYRGQQLPMTTPGQSGDPVLRPFNSMEQARAYAANTSNAQVGGIAGLPNERVPALEHYRLVSTSDMHAGESIGYSLTQLSTAAGAGIDPNQLASLQRTTPQWTKVFERVPGAELQGEAGANATVNVAVEMDNPATNRTFVYSQRTTAGPDGEFSLTVPYSTTGYDQWGPENGHTNVTVRATGEYRVTAVGSGDGSIQAWNGTASVPEAAVIGETDEPVTVEMNEIDTTPEGQDAVPNDGSSSGTDGTANATTVVADGLENGTGDTGDTDTETGTDGTDDANGTSSGLIESPTARTVPAP